MAHYREDLDWTRRFFSCLNLRIPVQRWHKFFVSSCFVALFVDPLFVFVLSVLQDKKCMVINWNLTLTIVVFRSFTDFIYLLHMLLQFRRFRGLRVFRARPETSNQKFIVGAPKEIALDDIRRFFLVLLDLFIVVPLPQIIVLLILPNYLGSSGANFAKNLIRSAILLQYIPRLIRFLHLFIDQSQNGFIFETVRANVILNLLTFLLSGHVVGSLWYLLGLQRVNQCLRDACVQSETKSQCTDFIDCGYGRNVSRYLSDSNRSRWINNENADDCFTTTGHFSYGIYSQAINLTTKQSVPTRYIYSLFWGFQQISTLAGNQVPSYFVWEVLFTMGIIGLGLLLFAYLIGNMQNSLQALCKRSLERSLRKHDFDQWIRHRRFPPKLKSKIRRAERANWAATRGDNELRLLNSLHEDLKGEIRKHLFSIVRQVWIFKQMDDHVLYAVSERLKKKIYTRGIKILYQGEPIDKMLFIVRGKLDIVELGRPTLTLTDSGVCGMELLTWCLDNIDKDGKKIKNAGHRLLSKKNVKCLTNVEAFVLRVSDLEEVLRMNPSIQVAIRHAAAITIQVAWRYHHNSRSSSSPPGQEGGAISQARVEAASNNFPANLSQRECVIEVQQDI